MLNHKIKQKTMVNATLASPQKHGVPRLCGRRNMDIGKKPTRSTPANRHSLPLTFLC